ncbi:hypothetical protein [Alteromonas gracilis]|uniref:hypothetical protein n=1 Tax=Alteromonas gracilis TaxID=1479524 RepID=UPI0030CE63DA
MPVRLTLVKFKDTFDIPTGFGKKDDVFSICYVDSQTLSVGVANYTQYLGYSHDTETFEVKNRQAQPSKPRLFSRSAFADAFDIVKKDGDTQTIMMPQFLGMSDEDLLKTRTKEWLSRRDKAFEVIRPLLPQDPYELSYFVTRYLRGEVHQEIKKYCEENGYDSTTTVTRKLNLYIVFGFTVNALLPFGFEFCGTEKEERNSKNGSNKKNNRRKRGRPGIYSDYRGVNESDKRIIKDLVRDNRVSHRGGKLDISRLYDEYVVRYEDKFNLPHVTINQQRDYEFSYPQSEIISQDTFRYHFKQLLPLKPFVIFRDGQHKYDKDHRPKRGDAKDGVAGAGHVVEFDHTQLDLHARMPGVHDKRYSAGRLYLVIAKDVYTKFILGFHISFRPPCWDNIAECIINCVENKVEFAARYGVDLTELDWPSRHLCMIYKIDNGVEYPHEQEAEIMASPFNFQGSQQVAKGRGDLKADSESTLGKLNRIISNNPGGINPDKDAMEQDASQQALLTIEDITAQLIDEIVLMNKTADRECSLDQDMLAANVEPTPLAQWNYSIKHQMSGGNPVPKAQIPALRYTLLPKHIARIDADGITLKKYPQLQYDGDFKELENWYLQKKHKVSGAKTEIKVAVASGSIKRVYYRDNNTIYPLDLKTQNSQYEDMSFFELEQSVKAREQMQRDRKNSQQAGRVYNKRRQKARIEANQKELAGVPVNSQRTYQKETQKHNRIMRGEQAHKDASRADELMSPDFPEQDAYASEPTSSESTLPTKPKSSREFY